MATFGLVEILLALVCFGILRVLALGSSSTDVLPKNWPLVGMLPGLLSQVGRIHEWLYEILLQSNCNILFRGPWFSGMDMLITVDPANIHYIMNANHKNFTKSPEFKRIFDFISDGISTADYEQWKDQRRVAVSLINHRKFHRFSARITVDKIQNGLIPILDNASRNDLVVDLQDLFLRFTFDFTCRLVTGFDSGCLSSELPEVPFAKAVDNAEEALLFRLILPEFLWKLQRWAGIGKEKKFSLDLKSSDRIIANYIETKREQIRRGESNLDEEGCDLLSFYMTIDKEQISGIRCTYDKFLHDTILIFLVAGRDTTASALTWFFWNLSKHPLVEMKIREEINSLAAELGEQVFESGEFINKLVYLHGAICESLRLYPPVPLEQQTPTKADVLPSGHYVKARTMIVFSLYAMGRMPSIWGEDCLEFKPERWISDRGTLRHEPSYKFFVFSAGPKTCPGKEASFTVLKSVAVAIIRNFQFQVEAGQEARFRPAIFLHMKHGMKVRVTKRSGF